MIEVELPNGAVAEFPNGTTPQQIQKALQDYNVKSTATERRAKMGPFRRALYGLERSFDESAMGLKQLTVGLTEDEKRELAIRRQIEKDQPGSSISRVAGDVLQFAVPGTAVLRGALLLPKALQAAAKIGGAAAVGGASGAIAPVLDGESRAQNAAVGAVFGAGGQVAGDLAGRAIEGAVKRGAGAQALPEAVQRNLTLGQTADRNSLSGRIIGATEERMQSIPIVGDYIRNARERGLNSWRQNLVNQVAPEGFTPNVANPIRNQMDEIEKTFRSRYAQALADKNVAPSKLFETQALRLITNPQSGVPDDVSKQVMDDVMRNYQSRFGSTAAPRANAGGGVAVAGGGNPVGMTGQSAKDFEAFLSGRARAFRLSAQNGSDPIAADKARLYEDLERAWTTSYYRQIGSGGRTALRELDTRYAPFKTVERAAGARGTADPGAFTPAQLDEAVATRTGRSRYARNQGILQDQAAAAREALTPRIPDSGTAERSLALPLAIGGGLIIDPFTTSVAVGSVPLLTSGPGKRLMTGQTAAQRLAQRIRLNEALRAGGAPIGAALGDAVNPDSTRYLNEP